MTGSKNIFLTGFMCSGKTTVGRKLARALGWAFVDLDQRIEARLGLSVTEVFARYGERSFRKEESRELQLVARGKRQVVALGGGALMARGNLSIVRRAGVLVYLRAMPRTILVRVRKQRNQRPLLKDLTPEQAHRKLMVLFAEREPAYREAGLSIRTDDLTPREIVSRLLVRLSGRCGPERNHGALSKRKSRARQDPGGQNRMKKITINLDKGHENRSYPVWIGRGLADASTTGDATRGLRIKWKGLTEKKAYLIADARLGVRPRRMEQGLRRAGWETRLLRVGAGESLKDFRSIYRLYGQLLEAGADRNSTIFALGGGSVGDAIGFVAGTFLRGVPWVNVPTTLLAQVDSAIGGKTGINHEKGKNLIGLFYQPALVLCDIGFLEGIPERENLSGLGEVVKYALIYDPGFFEFLRRNWKRILALDPGLMEKTIARCVSLKGSTVEKDERDRKGIREVLNFGHTAGHAFEATTGYGYLRHGEAVILGMRVELALSELRGYLSARRRAMIDAFLRELPVPELPRNLGPERIVQAVRYDKKKVRGKTRFVLLKDIGKTVLDTDVTPRELKAALAMVGLCGAGARAGGRRGER